MQPPERLVVQNLTESMIEELRQWQITSAVLLGLADRQACGRYKVPLLEARIQT